MFYGVIIDVVIHYTVTIFSIHILFIVPANYLINTEGNINLEIKRQFETGI